MQSLSSRLALGVLVLVAGLALVIGLPSPIVAQSPSLMFAAGSSGPQPVSGGSDGSVAVNVSLNRSATTPGIAVCDSSALAAVASATTTQLVALTSGQTIYVCGFVIEIQGVATTAGTAKLVYGTGTACATGTTDLTPDFIGSTTAGTPTVVAFGTGFGTVTRTAASNALCVTTTTTTAQKIFVSYAKF